MAAPFTSPELDPDFGLHYPDWLIRFCVMAMKAWHIPPYGWLDVPEKFIEDIIAEINETEAVEQAVKAGDYFGEVDDYDFGMDITHETDIQEVEF